MGEKDRQSYAACRLFFQSRNFPANLFWHQIGPDTDSWHWNVGCNFHLETVASASRAGILETPDNLKDRFLSSAQGILSDALSLSFWGIKAI